MDRLTASERSRLMSLIRSKNTRPELRVRTLIHGMGYRYRLHSRTLSGAPDLVFAGRRKVIFVHGCFWHGHSCRAGRNRPATNTEYWDAKLERNKKRDRMIRAKLKQEGWGVFYIWECQTRDTRQLAPLIEAFLESA